jgi:hypothetical protein
LTKFIAFAIQQVFGAGGAPEKFTPTKTPLMEKTPETEAIISMLTSYRCWCCGVESLTVILFCFALKRDGAAIEQALGWIVRGGRSRLCGVRFPRGSGGWKNHH